MFNYLPLNSFLTILKCLVFQPDLAFILNNVLQTKTDNMWDIQSYVLFVLVHVFTNQTVTGAKF